MGKRKLLFLTVLLLLIVLFWTLSSDNQKIDEGSKYLATRVKRVIDGDTIVLENGDRVRYIGIDTPELKDSREIVREFARLAKEANKKLVDKKEIRLKLDVQTRDRYGRLLAYIYVDTIFVNAYIVENGFAKVMTVPPNVRYAELFRKLQSKAVANRVGLWAEDL